MTLELSTLGSDSQHTRATERLEAPRPKTALFSRLLARHRLDGLVEVDVVVTDLWMPGVDGLQLLARWRAARPQTRFVVVSGGSRSMPLEVSTAAAEARGADAVVFNIQTPEVAAPAKASGKRKR